MNLWGTCEFLWNTCGFLPGTPACEFLDFRLEALDCPGVFMQLTRTCTRKAYVCLLSFCISAIDTPVVTIYCNVLYNFPCGSVKVAFQGPVSVRNFVAPLYFCNEFCCSAIFLLMGSCDHSANMCTLPLSEGRSIFREKSGPLAIQDYYS